MTIYASCISIFIHLNFSCTITSFGNDIFIFSCTDSRCFGHRVLKTESHNHLPVIWIPGCGDGESLTTGCNPHLCPSITWQGCLITLKDSRPSFSEQLLFGTNVAQMFCLVFCQFLHPRPKETVFWLYIFIVGMTNKLFEFEY